MVSQLIAPMSEKIVNSPNEFEILLGWLDKNGEDAALKYEKIRQKLIRIFYGRGCFEAEELADETFDRVAKKIPLIIETYSGEPSLYFYGVAYKIHQEWLRRQSKTRPLEFEERLKASEPIENNAEFECLDKCLAVLVDTQRKLVINYYNDTKRAKIDSRKKVAADLGISATALQIKVYRIRNRLRHCVKGCITKKK
jgi:RNA polymerase sigma factor (sigma-70 family)